jgi:tRNA dimethylallyltransferase
MNGVLILAGPTASGKTDLALELARTFDAEIVGADSRQIYAGMPVGTAAPSAEQLARVPHHLVGFLNPEERYSAGRYAQDAMAAIEGIRARGKRVVVAGGTGFYIRALAGDVELAPAGDADVRLRLAREARLHDAEFLYDWLRVRDPRRAEMLHAGDAYRVLRALEVALAERRNPAPPREVRTLRASGIPFAKVFLDVEEAELRARIARRTEAMLSGGLLDEAERIGSRAVAANAVGYPQALAYLRGFCTYDELRALLERATRRYAKRQQTWFRSEPETAWLRADAVASFARENLGWV